MALRLLLAFSLSGTWVTASLTGAKASSIAISFAEGGACVMLGRYEHGSFVSDIPLESSDPEAYFTGVKRSLGRFRANETLRGVDANGHSVVVSAGAIRVVEDLGEYSIDLAPIGNRPAGLAMFLSPGRKLSILRPQRQSVLAPEIDRQLRAKLQDLWRAHLPERIPEMRPSRYEVRGTIVESLRSEPGILAIQYSLELSYPDSADRGSATAFFLYSTADGRIVRASFGHPEWSNGSTVLTIRPQIYFRVGRDKKTYFLGEHFGGWEDASTYAIYDLRTGRDLLLCY
jgi:hypothetical protein